MSRCGSDTPDRNDQALRPQKIKARGQPDVQGQVLKAATVAASIGTDQFDHLLEAYIEHYIEKPPHHGLGNQLILVRAPPNVIAPIVDQIRLGRVPKSYRRNAAHLETADDLIPLQYAIRDRKARPRHGPASVAFKPDCWPVHLAKHHVEHEVSTDERSSVSNSAPH